MGAPRNKTYYGVDNLVCFKDGEHIRIHNPVRTIPDVCVLPENRCRIGAPIQDNSIFGG